MAELKLTAKGKNQELILAYLQENASEVLAEKINAGNKTLSGCWDYIRSRAREQEQNQCACIEDAVVYGWAVHYFEEDQLDNEKNRGNHASTPETQQRWREQEEREQQRRREKEEAERKLAEEAAAAKAKKEQEKAAAEAKKAAERAEKERKRKEAATGAVAGQTTLFDFFGNLEG